jgi:peptidoglycan/LPS O-acetylase OafA/YrhL
VAPSRAGEERQDFLDGLRGVAALFVVLHHAWLQAWPIDRPPTGATAFWTGWLLWGHFAVTTFIVISGYCLVLPLVRRPERVLSVREFFRRRARRILPPYYFGLALTLLLILTCIGRKTGTHWDTALPLTTPRLLAGLLLIPDVVASINHAYWSIGVECKIYLLFPVLAGSYRRYGLAAATALFTAGAYALAWLIHGTRYAAMSPHFLAMFCWGGAAAWIANSPVPAYVRLRYSRLWNVFAAGSVIALIPLCMRWGHQPSRWFIMDVCAGSAAAALLVLAARTKDNGLRRALSWPVWTGLGGFSYSLYLIHAPLLQVVWQYWAALVFRDPLSRFLATVFGGVPLIVGASWVFYQYCERPYLHNLCNFHLEPASKPTGGKEL